MPFSARKTLYGPCRTGSVKKPKLEKVETESNIVLAHHHPVKLILSTCAALLLGTTSDYLMAFSVTLDKNNIKNPQTAFSIQDIIETPKFI